MLHNRVKTILNEQQKAKQQADILKYNTLFNLAIKLREPSFRQKNNITLVSHLHVLSTILSHNPDAATFWNDRRRIIHFACSKIPSSEVIPLIESELDFAMSLPHSKSYALFRHFEYLLQYCESEKIIIKAFRHCTTLLE